LHHRIPNTLILTSNRKKEEKNLIRALNEKMNAPSRRTWILVVLLVLLVVFWPRENIKVIEAEFTINPSLYRSLNELHVRINPLQYDGQVEKNQSWIECR
jgi:hypothetical protein